LSYLATEVSEREKRSRLKKANDFLVLPPSFLGELCDLCGSVVGGNATIFVLEKPNKVRPLYGFQRE
jgi:hypothetical protein